MPAAAPAPPQVTAVKCKSAVTAQIPSGATALIPPISQGTQYGGVRCGTPFGSGVQRDSLTLLDSGDVKGSYTLYLGAGTVHGKYDLTPGEGPPLSTATFQTVTYTGKLNVVGGTGGFTGAKGKGKLTCSSPDGLHLSCADKLRLSQL